MPHGSAPQNPVGNVSFRLPGTQDQRMLHHHMVSLDHQPSMILSNCLMSATLGFDLSRSASKATAARSFSPSTQTITSFVVPSGTPSDPASGSGSGSGLDISGPGSDWIIHLGRPLFAILSSSAYTPDGSIRTFPPVLSSTVYWSVSLSCSALTISASATLKSLAT